jgi:uncharacterized protein YsxB (DUF464 family)
MIKVTISYRDGAFAELMAHGHAESAAKGHDLVCAAVSAVILGGINGLADGDGAYHLEKGPAGHLRLTSLAPQSDHDRTVIETIAAQIESLASSYPKNVRLERKDAK